MKISDIYESSTVPLSYPHPIYRESMVPMRDGKKMMTFYYLPEEKGRFPVILQRSCYPVSDSSYKEHGLELSKRGYAYVCQYCRGIGGSEGEWVPNEHERSDGYDSIIWLTKQPWAGDIGYSGSSYLALTGWACADLMPKQVKSLYLTHYGTDRYASAYQSGLFRHDVLTGWAMENAGFEIDSDYMESCRYRPHADVDENLWGGHIDWYRKWVTSTRSNDPYWSEGFWGMLRKIPSQIEVPVYIGEGWYDHHLGGAISAYEALSDKAKEHSFLNIGCWNHSFMPCMEGRETKNLENNNTLNMLYWFEETLKKGKIPEKRIRTYQINGDRWREWTQWPLPAKGVKEFYFTAEKEDRAYKLSDSPSRGTLSYVYDPENPVPSHGGESMFRNMNKVGSLFQPEAGYRDDVISFISEPAKEDISIVGNIRAELYVSSSAEDTAFTAKVMEVFPTGNSCNIRTSIATLAHREGATDYTPGEIVKVNIDMWAIDWLLKAGSRIRIDISSSDFPQFAVHSNFPGIWSLVPKTQKADQILHFGLDTPSKLILPSL